VNKHTSRVLIGAAATLWVLTVYWCTQGMIPWAVATAPQSAVQPPCSFPWDITKHGTVVDREFTVSEQHAYNFDIEFHHNGLPPGWSQFIGTGAVSFFTKDAPPKPVRSEDPTELYTRWSRGELQMKNADPGTVVPVHIRLTKVAGDRHTETVVVDTTIDTEAMYKGGNGAISRQIVRIPLGPGRYRVIATTLKDVPLPPAKDAYTAFGITYRVY
jgi:Domain of unknown function (DUF5625)